MSIHIMRFMLGILFLILGLAIFTRHWWLPGLDTRLDPLRLNLGAALALVFGGLNLARWYAVRAFLKTRQTPVRYSLQRDPSAKLHVEPNPEFDFTKQPDTEKAKDDQKPETGQ